MFQTTRRASTPHFSSPPKVLIYLDNRRTAERLATLLDGHRIQAVIIHTDTAFEELPAADAFDVVVTTTWMIGRISLRLQLPIINVERFVFTVIDSDAETPGSKRFDGEKFVAEVFEARDFQVVSDRRNIS